MDTRVSTPQAVATVIAVEGQAFARDPAGQMRPLQAGDVLLEGDTLVTLPGGQVQLAFADGQLLTVLPNEGFQFSAETAPGTRPDVAEAALPAGEADRIIQALERGENIDDLIDPTAAGFQGGGENGGNNFVRLLRIVEGVDPLSFRFESNTANIDFPVFESGGTPAEILETVEVPAVTGALTLNAPASVTEGGTIVYSVTVDVAPQGSPLVLTLSNGLTLTIPVGAFSATSAPVPVRADDVLAQGDTPVSVSVVGASGGGYTTLSLGSPATTPVSDDADVTALSLTADASVAEGGNITYTASLSTPAGTPLTITLSNGATISIAAGSSLGSVSVPAPSDDAHLDAGSVSATIVTASGGNFESLAVNPAAATTAITDTPDVTTVSLVATPSVAEGGNITYTASLNNSAQTPVSVTLSNGTVIGIAAGAASGSVSVAAPNDDVYLDAGSVNATIASATGGNFESLVVNPAAATTAITDTADITTISLSGSASVAEGGTAAYLVSLTNPAQTAVTVNFAYSGTATDGVDFTGVASVTIPAGSSSASFSIPLASDLDLEGAETLVVSISSASGGNFESLTINGAAGSVTTSVTDSTTTATVSLSASASVAEGGVITYTASLTGPALSPMSVTLDNGAVINIATGTSSGSTSVAAPADDIYVDAGNLSASIVSTTGGGFSILTVDPAPASTSVSDTIDSTTISITATASVAEGGNIVYTASLNNVAQMPVSVTLSNGAVISIAAGASSGTVSIAAPTDDVYLDAGSVGATITAATGGNFENLAINPASAITSITDTPDTTTLSLTASGSVAEGGNITYTASLNNVAQTPVSVTLSNGAVITIAAGASSGSVSVAAPTDDVYLDAGSVSATIASASGGNFETLTVTPTAAVTSVTDTLDSTTLSLSASASVAEGGNITYTASLNNVALTPVSVTLSNGAVISIAAGASSGSVSVAAPTDDVYVDAGSVSATIASAAGGNFENLVVSPVAATTSITDTLDLTTVSLSASASVAEGGNITYTASLNNVAQTPVSVTLSNGAVISIAAGASSGSVSVSAPADDVYVDAGSVSATITSAAGGNFESLAINPATATTGITDTPDTTTLSLTASASVAEGGNITYTASLDNVAQSPVTVTLSNGATISIAAG
ncbi:retention module-containing protein, partial [Thiobacillus sp.]|uniref:retention module-containing protein n=1 Tax=Thiobacillus sp. TaxID=924 RepID=UPI0025ED0043